MGPPHLPHPQPPCSALQHRSGCGARPPAAPVGTVNPEVPVVPLSASSSATPVSVVNAT